jgi:hypothetical protein
MNNAPTSPRPEHAARRLLRLPALLFLMLTVAACAPGAAAQTDSGATGVSSTQSGPITCVAPARPSPQGGCVTVDPATGISVRVTDAYADVTGTLVNLVATNTYNYPLSVSAQLKLASGYTLKATTGGHWGGPDVLIVDEPLPPQDFASQVELIVTTGYSPAEYNGMYPPTMPPAPPWLNHLDRISVNVPFMLSPPRSGSYTYHVAPIVKQGIGVQVQMLDVSPADSTAFGEAGGARIELRFTGLPADLELLSFIRVKAARPITDPGPNGGSGTSGNRGPGLFQLRIPGMTVDTPVMTLLQSPIWNPTGNETSEQPLVGPAGTVQFEVAFAGKGTPTGQPATLSISGIQRLTGGIDGVSGNVPTLPTYQITLPLH